MLAVRLGIAFWGAVMPAAIAVAKPVTGPIQIVAIIAVIISPGAVVGVLIRHVAIFGTWGFAAVA